MDCCVTRMSVGISWWRFRAFNQPIGCSGLPAKREQPIKKEESREYTHAWRSGREKGVWEVACRLSPVCELRACGVSLG